jgi:hypothetical protein
MQMHETWMAAILLSMQTTPAPADNEDIRCFIVAAEMADTQDREVQAGASIMLFYFLGKLDGRNANEDLKALIEREAPLLTEADRVQLTTSCSAILEARGKQLAE